MPYHLATAPSVVAHPFRDEALHSGSEASRWASAHSPRPRTNLGSSGKKHLGVHLAALPMNPPRTLWCAGAAGEVAAYGFKIELLVSRQHLRRGARQGRPSGASSRRAIQVQKTQNPPTSVSGDGRLLR